jgi:predicted kinase
MIRIITGPPCAGKSTFVRDNALPGDIVVDMDLIAASLVVDDIESHDYSQEVRRIARAARKSAVREALTVGQVSRRNVWIVHTDPNAEWSRIYRSVNARVTVVDPGRDVCLTRLAERPKGQHVLTKRVIDDYYNKR